MRKMKISQSLQTFFWDLGSLNGRLYVVDKGLIADAPTVLLRDRVTGQTAFSGQEAFALLEKVPSQLEPVRTIIRGKIADPSLSILLEQMMGQENAGIVSKILAPVAIATVSRIDPVHALALKRAFQRAGFREVIQIPQPAAILASRHSDLNRDGLIVDMGAGKTELTVMSGGHIFLHTHIGRGGDDLDELIKHHLEQHKGFLISLQDARELKLAYSFTAKKNKKSYLLGKDLHKGKISSLAFLPEELDETMAHFFRELLLPLESLLLRLSPSQIQTLKEDGLLLAGGLSQIEGLDAWISNQFQLPVVRVARAHIAPLLGAAKLFAHWDEYSYLTWDAYTKDY